MNILIVHAHHEAQSFCTSLANRAAEKLRSLGHQVDFRDLFAMKFDPISDRRNFTTTKDGEYLKQQAEEVFASENDGFASDIEANSNEKARLLISDRARQVRRQVARAEAMAVPFEHLE